MQAFDCRISQVINMMKAEFGSRENLNEKGDYTKYAPEKYGCIAIDDDKYLNDWWNALLEIDTLNVYSKRILQPQKALSRWGITIIPPSSLPKLLEIVISDKRYRRDKRLQALAVLIRQGEVRRNFSNFKHMLLLLVRI